MYRHWSVGGIGGRSLDNRHHYLMSRPKNITLHWFTSEEYRIRATGGKKTWSEFFAWRIFWFIFLLLILFPHLFFFVWRRPTKKILRLRNMVYQYCTKRHSAWWFNNSNKKISFIELRWIDEKKIRLRSIRVECFVVYIIIINRLCYRNKI